MGEHDYSSDEGPEDVKLVFKSGRSGGQLFSELPLDIQGRLLFEAMHHPDASTRKLVESRRLGS